MKRTIEELLQPDRLRRRVESLLEAIDKDAPSCLVAMNAMMVFRSVWVSCPESMAAEFGHWMREKTRVDAGLCQMCNSDVFPPQHPSLCELCEAKVDADNKRIDEELGNLP